jgi:hypothetical protein
MLRVFENRVLRRIFGSMRDEVTGGWRKLYNKDLHSLYSSPNIIRMIKSRRMRWAGHIVCMEEITNVYKILVGKPTRRQLRRSRCRWEDNITVDLRNIGLEGVEWINLAQDRDW